jgi:SAM-dependent methyltransferase
MLTKRSNCRLCLSHDVSMIYPMPACPPVDNYRFENEPEINLPAFPMDLYLCSACGHAQLLDVVDPNILFGHYIYTSSSSPDLDAHFTSYADTIVKYAALGADSLVVDIGSNDGLLLSKFKAHGVRVQGIDPAASVAQQAIAKGIPTVISFINPEAVKSVLDGAGAADVVCANNVFSHSDDLRGFAECARSLLKSDGFFVFEVSYLRDLVENKVIDYVYHEHLAHHSIQPLKMFFESLGMRLFDVERIVTKGGSIRCFAALKGSKWHEKPVIAQMIAEERAIGLYDRKVYDDLKKEMDLIGEKTRSILGAEVAKKVAVASYGASATTTVLNAMFDIDKYISFIVDDNPVRQGRLSPGAKIPVKSKADFLAANPPVTFIAAWRFADMIISRNKEYLDGGGRFIVPLPVFKVVSRNGVERQ